MTAPENTIELTNEVLQQAAEMMLQKTKFNAAVKKMDKDQLNKLSGFLGSRLEKLEADYQKMLEERADEKALADKVKAALEEKGMTLEDVNMLTGGFSKKVSRTKSGAPRKPVSPKYAITDAEGNEVLWSGRGKRPLIFTEYVEKGGNLDDLLIGDQAKAS